MLITGRARSLLQLRKRFAKAIHDGPDKGDRLMAPLRQDESLEDNTQNRCSSFVLRFSRTSE